MLSPVDVEEAPTETTAVDAPPRRPPGARFVDPRTLIDATPPIELGAIADDATTGRTTAARIGRYHVVSTLGAGGMAEVLLAELRGPFGFRKRYAIKRLHASLCDDTAAVERFAREAHLAARLEHPAICQVYELGEDEAGPFIVMEYLAGATLSQLLVALRERRCALSLASAVRVIAELCEGLAAAHALCDEAGAPLGLVHRDVSPSNVVITLDGKVKLLDFGVAKIEAVRTQSGQVRGKYGYMSPEQLQGRRVDRRTDVFALGVVLFEALSARRLFTRSGIAATTDAVLHQPVPDLRRFRGDVPAAVVAVVARALARDREARFPSALALRDALVAAAAPTAPAAAEELAALAALVVGRRASTAARDATSPAAPTFERGSDEGAETLDMAGDPAFDALPDLPEPAPASPAPASPAPARSAPAPTPAPTLDSGVAPIPPVAAPAPRADGTPTPRTPVRAFSGAATSAIMRPAPAPPHAAPPAPLARPARATPAAPARAIAPRAMPPHAIAAAAPPHAGLDDAPTGLAELGVVRGPYRSAETYRVPRVRAAAPTTWPPLVIIAAVALVAFVVAIAVLALR